MSAAAKAEARRKAILSRGSDRLSKLTTSARGDDAPQFVHNDPPPPDPPVWSNEQQLQTFLGGPPPSDPFNINTPVINSAVPDDPLIALMSSLGTDPGMGWGAGDVSQSIAEAKPKTVIQKLLPILHIIAVWALVAFFIFWQEPESFRARNSAVVSTGDMWNRWARLASSPVEEGLWAIEIVPFFRAFVSLELALHSMRFFLNFDPVKPPLFLTLALPYLPRPLPSILMYSLRYLQLIGTLADDLAAAVVAIGLYIAASSLYESWSSP